ncbi:30S ribosomal protein S6 [Candidatus Uhrbacteria bacterium]|nr:30S ribosomal protein S6 [Candidatus Uhrbacteria bacterium]
MKYELLALLPLTGTDEELTVAASKIEERIRLAGGVVAGGASIHKGRMSYPIKNVRQGYYHLIQFEMEPGQVNEFKRQLTLAQEALRFTLTGVSHDFKTFVPSPPRVSQGAHSRFAKPEVSVATLGHATLASSTPVAHPQTAVASELEATPKVSMEEIDKKLEEILGA